jgi:hypothetical protein
MEAWFGKPWFCCLSGFHEAVDILKEFQKRYMIRATGTGPKSIKRKKGNILSKENSPDYRGEWLLLLEHPFFSK